MKFNLERTTSGIAEKMGIIELHTLEGLLAFSQSVGEELVIRPPEQTLGRGDDELWTIEIYDGYRE